MFRVDHGNLVYIAPLIRELVDDRTNAGFETIEVSTMLVISHGHLYSFVLLHKQPVHCFLADHTSWVLDVALEQWTMRL